MYYKYMNDKLIQIYNKIQSTKCHLWSHILAFTGWGIINILCFININFLFNSDSSDLFFLIMEILGIIYFFSILSIILFIFLFILEKYCFRNYKIKLKFLLNNSYYNIIWNIGIFVVLLNLIITAIIFIFQTFFIKH